MAKVLADMDLFSIVEAGKVIISERGIYRQVELYERAGTLFAAFKGGFVRLLARNLTTVPHVKWEAIEGITFDDQWNGPKQTGSAGGLRLVAAE